MSDTSGPTSGTPLAQYDPIERCWKTSEATCLWALTLSSLTLPTWGGLHGGELYEHPTPARLTSEPGYSSSPLIGTPTAGLGMGGGKRSHTYDPHSTSKRQPNPRELIETLPTPRAQNGEPRNQTIYKREGPQNLENALAVLPLLGEITPPQLTAGNTSQDDLHRLQLSLLPEDNA